MCMHVKDEAINHKVSKDGFILGYKVLINSKEDKNTSPSQLFQYVLGENISGRTSKELQDDEKYGINRGFHIFINLKAAKQWKSKDSYFPEKIIKVYYKLEDIVAHGYTYLNNEKLPTVVVMKLIVKSFDKI